jgi:hypothetical protein
MKTAGKTWLLGLLAATAACDPFTAANTSPAEVFSVFTSNGFESSQDTDGSDGWAVTTPGLCVPGAGVVVAAQPVLFVTANKLLAGESIQSGSGDCLPAGNPPWLKSTTPPVTGSSWYSCYQPASPDPQEGGSVVIFQAAAYPGPSGEGWFDLALLPGDATSPITYGFSGTVRDQEGNPLAVGVQVTVEPASVGEPPYPVDGNGDPAPFTNVTQSSLVFTWLDASCASGVTYQVQRADLGIPGDECPPPDGSEWTDLSPTTSGLSFADSGLSPATAYCYRVSGSTSTPAFQGPWSLGAKVETLP